MKMINKQQEQRRTIHKAAEVCAEYQDAWVNKLFGTHGRESLHIHRQR